MAFIKTTLTDHLSGKNWEVSFNTEYITTLQPAKNCTIIRFSNGQEIVVDLPYEDMAKFVQAKPLK